MNSRLPGGTISDGIAAAQEIYAKSNGWRSADAVLERVASEFQSSDFPSVLAKATILNALYSTGIQDVFGLAHIWTAKLDVINVPTNLDAPTIEQFAHIDENSLGKMRWLHSFASKYAHFFISSHYPIIDSYAVIVLNQRYPERPLISESGSGRYIAFCDRFLRLVDEAQNFAVREIDRYLWIKGQILRSARSRSEIANRELRELRQLNRSLFERV